LSVAKKPSSVIEGLQIVRALAAIEVTWLHVGQDLGGTGFRSPFALDIFGVDVFFVLSGFIMTRSLARVQTRGLSIAWHFLRRRMIRIYPMFWLVAAANTIVAFLHFYRGVNIVPMFLLLPPLHPPYTTGVIDQSWSLVFEMLFYVTLSVCLLLTPRAAQAAAVFLTVCILAGAPFSIVHPVVIFLCNPIIFEFLFGVMIALLTRKGRLGTGVGQVMLVVGIAALVFFQLHNPTQATSFQMILMNVDVVRRVMTWGLAAALIVAGVVIWSGPVTSRVGRLFVLLGNASYSLYLTSTLVTLAAFRVIDRLPRSNALWVTYGLQLLVVAFCCAVSVAAYLFVESPMTRRLHARFG
jgi:exopolysaccharide production protein ExoZ